MAVRGPAGASMVRAGRFVNFVNLRIAAEREAFGPWFKRLGGGGRR